MIATKTALEEGGPWLEEALTFLEDNRRRPTRTTVTVPFRATPALGALLALLPCRLGI
jgi:bifunctional pyridoxal-dependent enzyme with beta-cystathionase and maltose regulon repressor activities